MFEPRYCDECDRLRAEVARLEHLLSPMPTEGPCLPRGDDPTGGVVGRHGSDGWDAQGAPVEGGD